MYFFIINFFVFKVMLNVAWLFSTLFSLNVVITKNSSDIADTEILFNIFISDPVWLRNGKGFFFHHLK